MKRKLKWLAVVLAVSLLGLGTALLLWPRDRITAASWKQIRIGMTENQVEEILGQPGMSSEECKFFEKGQFLSLQLAKPIYGVQATFKYWTSQRGTTMQIGFDERGHVSAKRLWSSGEPSFLDRIRDWLGW